MTAAGQPLEFTGPAPAITVAPDGDTAAWTAHARSAAGHRLDIEGDMEYDGMCRYDVTLTPAELLELDGVQLRIPYRPEIVRLAHAGL